MSFFGTRGAIDAVAELLQVLNDPAKYKSALEDIAQAQASLKASQDVHANVKEQAATSLADAEVVKRALDGRAAEMLNMENGLKAWEAENAARQTAIEGQIRQLVEEKKAFDEQSKRRVAELDAYATEQTALWDGRITEFKAEMVRQRNEIAVLRGELNEREAAIVKREADLQSRIDALKAL